VRLAQVVIVSDKLVQAVVGDKMLASRGHAEEFDSLSRFRRTRLASFGILSRRRACIVRQPSGMDGWIESVVLKYISVLG
jgi:hypothetical protein